VVWRRGRLGTVCARGAHPAWSSGPSTSPLESAAKKSPEGESSMRRAIAKTLRLAASLVRARALCNVVSGWFGYRCVCRICGCA